MFCCICLLTVVVSHYVLLYLWFCLFCSRVIISENKTKIWQRFCFMKKKCLLVSCLLVWSVFLWIVTGSFSYSFSSCTMQPQSIWFYGMVKQFLFCFSDTSTTLAPPTVLPRWSHLKGVTKSSSALSAELKKERRCDIFYLIAICTHDAPYINFLAIPVS